MATAISALKLALFFRIFQGEKPSVLHSSFMRDFCKQVFSFSFSSTHRVNCLLAKDGVTWECLQASCSPAVGCTNIIFRVHLGMEKRTIFRTATPAKDVTHVFFKPWSCSKHPLGKHCHASLVHFVWWWWPVLCSPFLEDIIRKNHKMSPTFPFLYPTKHKGALALIHSIFGALFIQWKAPAWIGFCF